MAYQFIEMNADGQVTRIVLNRPEVHNALNQQMHDELQDAFDCFQRDDNQRVCVLSGAGNRAFCAGTDLKSVARSGHAQRYPRCGYAGLIERFELDKPLIAAVDGVAVGGGFEIALACDLLLATRRSRFGLPEPTVGAVALAGGLHRLARQIHLKQAMRLLLGGELVDAEEGQALGFVSVLVENDQLESAVADWCERILRCAPLSIRATKQTVMRGLDEPDVRSAIAHQKTYPAFQTWQNSDDRKEGARAFAEKRKPKWQGR